MADVAARGAAGLCRGAPGGGGAGGGGGAPRAAPGGALECARGGGGLDSTDCDLCNNMYPGQVAPSCCWPRREWQLWLPSKLGNIPGGGAGYQKSNIMQYP